MPNFLTKKLERLVELDDGDRALLDQVTKAPSRVEAGKDIIQEGDRPKGVTLICNGLAFRYKLLDNGKRQIVDYLLPGDFCDLHIFILDAMDHSIATFVNSTVVRIPRADVETMLTRPSLATAFQKVSLIDEATLREWIVNMGQRSAEDGLAHLLCEMYVRLHAIGMVNAGMYDLPVTQMDLGDTLGLSTVHVNRSMMALRSQGLVYRRGHRVTINDIDALIRKCGFRSNYLHLTSA